MNRELLKNLHQTTEFQMLLTELKKIRPIVPQYDPKSNNIEEMKAQSCKQQSHDTLMSIIDPF